jgi:hypothetical protein
MKSQPQMASRAASKFIDEKIEALGDWRGVALARMRGLIAAADPDVLEEVKWMGTPVWSHDGGPLHGRDLQGGRQADLLQGRFPEGPSQALQLEPRGKSEARHRHSRGREGRRDGVQGAHPRGRGSQHGRRKEAREA